uniref:Uncharacterized protein n=1 Tax=Arundo donax TaxID=35708 RepID=A0A0A8YG02_ARUDO
MLFLNFWINNMVYLQDTLILV